MFGWAGNVCYIVVGPSNNRNIAAVFLNGEFQCIIARPLDCIVSDGQ